MDRYKYETENTINICNILYNISIVYNIHTYI